MPLHTFVDGYNLIWSSSWPVAGSLDQQRQKLVTFLEERYKRGSSRNEITVVFDGRPGRSQTNSKDIRVVFSYDTDADSVIKERVDALDRSWTAIVVTNDKEIQKWVKGAKAKVLSCEEFIRGSQTFQKPQRVEKEIPPNADRITEDLKRLWKG